MSGETVVEISVLVFGGIDSVQSMLNAENGLEVMTESGQLLAGVVSAINPLAKGARLDLLKLCAMRQDFRARSRHLDSVNQDRDRIEFPIFSN